MTAITSSSAPLATAAATQSASAQASTPPERKKLAEASRQFEAIFVRQMLAEARKTDFGGDDLLGGGGVQTFREMQDDKFADIAAKTGAFGLASQIEAQLSRFLPAQGK